VKYRKKETKGKAAQNGSPHTEGKSERPVVTVDYERYAHFLENADLTEDQKREFLQTIWNIIVEFVSLGFGVHPLQQVNGSCGKPKDNAPISPLTTIDGVYLDHQLLTGKFERATDQETVRRSEQVES